MASACLDKNKPWRCRRSPFGNLFEDNGVCLEDEPLHSKQIIHSMVVQRTAMRRANRKATILLQQMDHSATMWTKLTIKDAHINATNMHINVKPCKSRLYGWCMHQPELQGAGSCRLTQTTSQTSYTGSQHSQESIQRSAEQQLGLAIEIAAPPPFQPIQMTSPLKMCNAGHRCGI